MDLIVLMLFDWRPSKTQRKIFRVFPFHEKIIKYLKFFTLDIRLHLILNEIVDWNFQRFICST